MLAFYSSCLKGSFFCSLGKSPWYVPAKYSETNNTKQCPRRNEKYISYIHFAINFCIPENSYFHTIFTILVVAQIRRIICWGKRIKRTQMKWFLYLIIQDCQTWIGIYLEKLNVWTSIRICKMCRINIVCQ